MTQPPSPVPEMVSRTRYNREKSARKEAEQLLEARSRQLYEVNRSLAAALEKEKRLVRLQDALITSINHEFRTPLTIVDGVASRIEKIADGENRDEILNKCGQIRNSVQTLTTLIESALRGFGNRRDDVVMPIEVQPLTRQPMSER